MVILRGLGNLIALVLIAVVVPLFRGFEFFDPLFLLPYASLPVVLAAGLAAKRPPTRSAATSVAARAWLFGVFVIAAGIGVVNFASNSASLLMPTTLILLATALFSLAAIALTTAVVMRFRVRELVAKLALMAIIVAAVWGVGKLPDSIQAMMTSVNLGRAALFAAALMLPGAIALIGVLDRHQTEPLSGDSGAGEAPVA